MVKKDEDWKDSLLNTILAPMSFNDRISFLYHIREKFEEWWDEEHKRNSGVSKTTAEQIFTVGYITAKGEQN